MMHLAGGQENLEYNVEFVEHYLFIYLFLRGVVEFCLFCFAFVLGQVWQLSNLTAVVMNVINLKKNSTYYEEPRENDCLDG